MTSNTKSLILLTEDGLIESNPAELNLIKLFHPKGFPAVFVQIEDNILELQTFQPSKFGSWFINQRVSSDSFYYIGTRIDPRFLFLPYLEKSSGKFSPLDQIVTIEADCSRISLDLFNRYNLEDICDTNSKLGDIVLFRYNEDKMLKWLKSKVEKVSVTLAAHRIIKDKKKNVLIVDNFNSSAQSVNSIEIVPNSLQGDSIPNQNDLIESVNAISDYLSDKTTSKLIEYLNLKESDFVVNLKSVNAKRKSDWETELEIEKETKSFNKPQSLANTGSSVVYNKVQKKASTSVAKIPANIKSITSFFNKKSTN